MTAKPARTDDDDWRRLMGRLRVRDPDAVNEVFHMMSGRIGRAVESSVKGADREIVDSAVAFAFAKLWEQAGHGEVAFGTPSRMRSWLQKVAFRQGCEEVRRRDRQGAGHGIPNRDSGVSDPSEDLAKRERSETLERALELLCPEDRYMLRSIICDDRSPKAVAEELRVKVDVVYKRTRRAFEKTQAVLRRWGWR